MGIYVYSSNSCMHAPQILEFLRVCLYLAANLSPFSVVSYEAFVIAVVLLEHRRTLEVSLSLSISIFCSPLFLWLTNKWVLRVCRWPPQTKPKDDAATTEATDCPIHTLRMTLVGKKRQVLIYLSQFCTLSSFRKSIYLSLFLSLSTADHGYATRSLYENLNPAQLQPFHKPIPWYTISRWLFVSGSL